MINAILPGKPGISLGGPEEADKWAKIYAGEVYADNLFKGCCANAANVNLPANTSTVIPLVFQSGEDWISGSSIVVPTDGTYFISFEGYMQGHQQDYPVGFTLMRNSSLISQVFAATIPYGVGIIHPNNALTIILAAQDKINVTCNPGTATSAFCQVRRLEVKRVS